MNTDPQKSAQPCGCDEGADHMCERHKEELAVKLLMSLETEIRNFNYTNEDFDNITRWTEQLTKIRILLD